jgi:tetratricopeptide (TPR) repeat protein
MAKVERTVRAARLHTRAIALRAAGKIREAERCCRQAAALFEQVGGKRSPDAIHARVELGEMAELRGDLSAAVRLLEEGARHLRREASAQATPADVRGLYLRAALGGARVRQLRGEYTAVERAYRGALRWAARHMGKGSAEVATVLTAQGVLRKAQGRYGEALKLYRKALPIVRRQRGPKAADIAALHHNLAGSEHARGRLAQAEVHARRGLGIRRRAFGPRDPGVIADEAALAPILDGLGKHSEAEALYRRALRLFTAWYGPRSYEVAVNLGNLGALYRNTGNLRKAEEYFRKALAVEEGLLGKKHAEVALSLNNLAVVLEARDKAGAVKAYRRALGIFGATVGNKHPYFLSCKRNLARLESGRGAR